MKRISAALLIGASCIVARPQGTVFFGNNSPGSGINAPVYDSDGTTPLSGSQFMATLLGGYFPNNLASVATTEFLTGAGAGYFNDGIQAINNVTPGNAAWVQVEVWNTLFGATFDEAKASGLPNSWWASSKFSVVTGGNTGFNVLPPGVLTGLGTSPVYLNSVPEPSTLALAALGAAFLRFRIVQLNRRSGSSYSPKD